jgi:hypothetical protein
MFGQFVGERGPSMGHASVVSRGLDLLGKGWRPLAALVLCLDVPPILGEAITVGGGYLPAEMASPLWALMALVLLPLGHGATLFVLKGQFEQKPIKIWDGLRRLFGENIRSPIFT